MRRKENHYDYLAKHLPGFFKAMGIDYSPGIITAHGDKGYSYREFWEQNGITFNQGMAIYLLSYCEPFRKECRETENGWVPVEKWIVANKNRFLPYLPS